MSESKAIKLSSKHHTFLTRRFDRSGNSVRHLYTSAMTRLGKKDGESADASYLDIAELIIAESANPKAQLHELWKRIVFSILVSNTDDHLRNHGFLYNFEKMGWDLSPAFDINPILGGKGLSLSIDEHDNSLELDCARQVAPYFQMDKDEAESTISHMLAVRAGWRLVAKKLGIKAAEIDLMTSVFEAKR